MRRQSKRKLATAVRFTLLSLWFLIVAFPMYWMFATSFKPDHEWFAWPPVYWSSTPTLDNYRTVWTSYTSALATQMAESMQKPWEALQEFRL